VASELGPEGEKRVFSRVTDERVATTESTLSGMTLEQKVEVLKSLYFEGDPYMEAEEVSDGFVLIERNCPYLNTAMRRPAFCSISVNALARLLGVRVAREEKFQNGAGRCVFHVYANEPIDSANYEFRLESET